MGAQYSFEGPEFNRSIRIEARPERLSSDAGALMLREVAERLGLLTWLKPRLDDPRDPLLVSTRSPPPVLPSSKVVLHRPRGGRGREPNEALRRRGAYCDCGIGVGDELVWGYGGLAAAARASSSARYW